MILNSQHTSLEQLAIPGFPARVPDGDPAALIQMRAIEQTRDWWQRCLVPAEEQKEVLVRGNSVDPAPRADIRDVYHHD
jgi:hypothetical protein